DLAKELDVSFSYSPLVIPRLDLGQGPGSMRITPDEFLDMRKRFSRFHDKAFQKPKKTEKKSAPAEEQPGFWERDCLFHCMAGHTGTFINPYGEMKACMTVPEPHCDALKDGVVKCWDRIKDFVRTLKAPSDWECYTCEYNAWCSWCPGRGYLNTGDIFGCPPYFKELAKVRKRRNEEWQQKKAREAKETVG
ncbi:MAG: hypothetical protein KAR06_12660, partial [Deltaproteobacteria bacterium]|nr:hypothetical protein [Deltaproteobacteria bacterium]